MLGGAGVGKRGGDEGVSSQTSRAREEEREEKRERAMESSGAADAQYFRDMLSLAIQGEGVCVCGGGGDVELLCHDGKVVTKSHPSLFSPLYLPPAPTCLWPCVGGLPLSPFIPSLPSPPTLRCSATPVSRSERECVGE